MKDFIVVPTAAYSHSQMLRDIDALKLTYPELIRSESAGFSVEGRELPLLQVGSGNRKVFFCATHHARDYITSAYLMYVVNVYAKAAFENHKMGRYNMRELLSSCTMYVMPMINPDGVALVQSGLKAVQEPKRIADMVRVRPSYSQWMANINGVDLGRQYPALWEKKYTVMTQPASELYNGEEPGSEPEVLSVMRVCKNNVFISALAFYAKGETIDYADDNTNEKIPEAFALAKRLAAVSGYAINTVCDNPGVYAAGFENWFRQEFLRPALHINLSPATGGAMPHHDRGFFTLVWDRAKALCAETLSTASKQKLTFPL